MGFSKTTMGIYLILLTLSSVSAWKVPSNWTNYRHNNGTSHRYSLQTGIPIVWSKVEEDITPRHVHLSLKFPSKMTVTFSTVDIPDFAYVEYGTSPSVFTWSQDGIAEFLVSRSPNQLLGSQYIHEVTLEGLVPGQSYYYRCVSRIGGTARTFYSNTYKFRLPLSHHQWSPNLIVFGDLGLYNAVSLPKLKEEVDSEAYDAMIHLGDIAYNLNEDGGKVGDDYLEQMEEIIAKIPYQVAVGNHERDLFGDYNDYSKRFRMPGDMNSLTYSWDLGPIHFISINTEDYFRTVHKVIEQYRWLQKDLKEANRMRDIRPWIIVYGHTPMYCSTNVGDSCQNPGSSLRIGCGEPHCPGLEKLFFDEGVDLFLWGHKHSYEATFPMYDYAVYNGSLDAPYTNPKAPVHVTTGIAGCEGSKDLFDDFQPNWSRFRNIDYGYVHMKILNASHLYFEQVSATTDEIIDSFTLIKDTYNSYSASGKLSTKHSILFLGQFLLLIIFCQF